MEQETISTKTNEKNADKKTFPAKLKEFFVKHKKLTITLSSVIGAILIFILLCLTTYIPKTGDTDYTSSVALSNPNICEKTQVSAHRAGRFLAPENTMAAFRECFDNMDDYAVDVLEFDLHLTKDGDLILLHDDTLDRTSDCKDVYGEKKVEPINKTVSELKQYNMGYHFELNGKYPYRDMTPEQLDAVGARITTLREVLDYLKTQEEEKGLTLHYIIEIKNGKEAGYKAADILAATLDEYGLTERTIVGTFNGEVSKYLDEKHPEITRSAGIAEVLGFYFGSIFGVPLNNVKYKVLQIPYKDFGINFGKKSLIDYAHKYGIAVQFWTINKAEDVEHLTMIGADAIMSDDPKMAYDVITAFNVIGKYYK